MSQAKTYQCYAANEKLARGRINGTVRVTPAGLHFQSDKGEVQFPISGAVISLGGASDRIVMMRHPGYPDWTLSCRDRSILNDPHLAHDPFVSKQLVRARRRRIFNWSVAIGVCLALIIIPVILLSNIGLLSRGVAAQIPADWEAQLGASAISDFQSNNPMMEQERSDPLLAPLVDPLLASVPGDRYDFNFYIMHDESLNAFALPGGYVVIHTGLIEAADAAEEVLGVVAHEIAHVTEQHGLRNIINTAGIYIIITAVLGDLSGVLGIITDASYLLLRQSYSRDFETEADETGHALLTEARIDPRGLARFFEKLLDVEDEMMSKIENDNAREMVERTLGFLSTHPATQDRIDNLRSMWENESSGYRDLEQPFRRLKAEVEQFVAEANEESTGDEGGN